VIIKDLKTGRLRNESRRDLRLREEMRLEQLQKPHARHGNPVAKGGGYGSGGGRAFIRDMCARWRATRSGLRNQMRRLRQRRMTMERLLLVAARGVA